MNSTQIDQNEEIKVKFDLEGTLIAENKVYATITIEPKSAEKNLDSIKLIVGNEQYKIDGDYHKISIAGFQTGIYIAKIHASFCYNDPPKAREIHSNSQTIHVDEYIYNIIPIISWDTKKQPILIVKWKHIGDKKAQEYLLYLDKKMIVHISQREICDELTVRIENVRQEENHLIEIVARLFNGKITCHSGQRQTLLSEIPKNDTKPYSSEYLNVLTIRNEEKPSNLLIIPPEKEENSPHEQNQKRFEELLEKLKRTIEERRKNMNELYYNDCRPHHICCNQRTIMNVSLVKSSKFRKTTTAIDDDDDVIAPEQDI